MKVEQRLWTQQAGWDTPGGLDCATASLVLAFGSTSVMQDQAHYDTVRAWYPQAVIAGVSTAGEIRGARVYDEALVVVALTFETTTVRAITRPIADAADSLAVGREIAEALRGDDLVHLLVLSEGLQVNGSALAQGLQRAAPAGVHATGGLAADGSRFAQTWIWTDAGIMQRGVVGIGFYGRDLRVGCGSMGGWDPFGPDRVITRSVGNVLYELDGAPALDLYKSYLGPHAADLPASALLFPLSIHARDHHSSVVRTVLAVNDAEGSMTFAGDVPEGHIARLMKANVDRLIDGAQGAASAAVASGPPPNATFALLVSCVGRRLVLKQRVEEELEAVEELLERGAVLAGFYSYGELAPGGGFAECALHNQTMTVTTFSETPGHVA